MSQQKPIVVLVDYDKKRSERHAQGLTEAGVSVVRAAGGRAALDHCRTTPPFAVVSEAMIPDGNGFELLRALKGDPRTARVRVLLVVDEDDSYTLSRAQISGLDGILIRPFTEEALVARIMGLEAAAPGKAAKPGSITQDLLPALTEMEQRARQENPLLPQLTDPVTGLWNKHYTDLKLADEFKKARRFSVPLSCLVLSLDDNPGDPPPDAAAERHILGELAGLLLCESRDIDHLSRLDTRHFLVVLPHTDAAGALAMTNRVLTAIEKRHIVLPGRTRPVAASAGIASFSKDLAGPDDLVKAAHEAVAKAIALGGNRVEVARRDTEKAVR